MDARLQEEIRAEVAKSGISEAMAWHVVMTREIKAGRIVPLSAESFNPDQPRDEFGRWSEVGLEGSEKQVSWAKEIRAKKHPGMKAVLDELDSPELTEDYWDDSDRQAAKALVEKAATRSKASAWIDERDRVSVLKATKRDPFSFATREEAELQEKRDKAIDWAYSRVQTKWDREKRFLHA